MKQLLFTLIGLMVAGIANAADVPDFDNLTRVFCSGGRMGGFCSGIHYVGYNCVLDQLKDGSRTANAIPTGSERICDGLGCDPKDSVIPVFATSTINLELENNMQRAYRRFDTSFDRTGVEEMNTRGDIANIENLQPGDAKFSEILNEFGSQQTSGMSKSESRSVTLIKVYHIDDAHSQFEDEKSAPAPRLLIRFFSAAKQVGGSVLERTIAGLPTKTLARVCTSL
jgi:hypothetical protein